MDAKSELSIVSSKIKASIYALRTKVALPTDPARRKEFVEGSCRALEVAGLWAAALVGIWAVVSAGRDADKQRDIMSKQIEAMKSQQQQIRTEGEAQRKVMLQQIEQTKAQIVGSKQDAAQQREVMSKQTAELSLQRKAMIAQLRAEMVVRSLIARQYDKTGRQVEKGSGAEIDGFVFYTNVENNGQTDAKNVRMNWGLTTVPVRKDDDMVDCPNYPQGLGQIPPKVIEGHGTVMLEGLRLPYNKVTEYAYGPDKRAIFAVGRIEYEDIFEHRAHFADWCTRIFPNDARNSVFSYFVIRRKTDEN